MDEVKSFIETLKINADEYIIVACSGGPDSMFLLSLLHDLGYKCVCAHVNHNLRLASKDEYRFLEEYCAKNNIIFEGMEITEYHKDNFHNDAHHLRYKFFNECVKKYQAHYLFTAHHGDDLVETILMRLMRKSNLAGYRGFDVILNREGFQIVRPLVFLTKAAIEEFDKTHNIPYVTDESNATDHYLRNRIRHYVLPPLKKECPHLHQRFLDFNKTITEYYEYISEIVAEKYPQIYHNNTLDIVLFKKEHSVIQKEILERILKYFYLENLYLIDQKHIEVIKNLIYSDKANGEVTLPGNLLVIKAYNTLSFSIENKIVAYDIPFEDKVSVALGTIKRVKKCCDSSNYTLRLNSKDIALPLHVVSFQEGDRMQVKNMTNTKKVSDIFINAKVNKYQRKRWPLVCDNNRQILWIPGIKKSNFDVSNSGLYDIILKYEEGDKFNEQEN